MRKTIVAGNWKMNLDRNQAADLAKSVVQGCSQRLDVSENLGVILCPPAIYLESVIDQTMGSKVAVGSQNIYFAESGAFTGEQSAGMVADIGCGYTIVGHSERRAIFGESDELVQKKAIAAIAAGISPIVCLGESLEQRESGNTMDVIQQQFTGSLAGLDDQQFGQVVIAYEPVWAIGTGKVATPEQAQEVHADLRKMVESRYNPTLADQVSILYGGSVKPGNAAELMAQPDIDGALVGGASLKDDSFLGIIEASA